MSYRLGRQEALHLGIQRIVSEELGAALRDLARARDDPLALHEARKRIKRVRAALALGRPALGPRATLEDRRLRAVARLLARHREGDAVLQMLDSVACLAQSQGREALRTAVGLHHAAHTAPSDRRKDLVRARKLLTGVRQRIARMNPAEAPASAVRRRFRKAYKAARRAHRSARTGPTPEALHDWRKRVKLLLNEARLLRSFGGTALTALRRSLEVIDDQLGHARDSLELAGRLRGVPAAYTPVRSGLGLHGVLEETVGAQNAAALGLGSRVFRRRSRGFVGYVLDR